MYFVELYHINGHLAQGAFVALQNARLCEKQRTDIAQHLDICDVCLEKYIKNLEQNPLLCPPKVFLPKLSYNILRQNRGKQHKKSRGVCVGILLAAGLWAALFAGKMAQGSPT